MIRHLLPCLLVLCLGGTATADYGFSVGIDRSETSNLFEDTSDVSAPSPTTKFLANFSPFSFLEVSGQAEYTYYPKQYDSDNLFYLHDLTNKSWGISGVWIPISANSAHRAYIQAGYEDRQYYDSMITYDSRTVNASAIWGYELSPGKSVRMGSKFTVKRYPISSTADNEQFELFAGANITVIQNNSLDVEVGWGNSTYKYIDAEKHPYIEDDPYLPTQIDPADSTAEGSFSSIYFSPRISRPLGSKTGVSLTLSYRHFFRDDKAVVLGFSTASLSPWNTFFDGTSVQLRVKTFLLPSFIVSGGTAYWDKKYIKTVELVDVFVVPPDLPPEYAYWETQYGRPDEAEERHDWQSMSFIEIQRPIVISRDFTLEPSVSILYDDNRSSIDLYDYTSWTIRMGVSLRH